MKSSSRSKLGGWLLFFLIAGVVIGGMGWATKSRLELATAQIRKEHADTVSRAVEQLSIYMGGILNSEGARPFTDYLRYHLQRTELALSPRGAEVDAEWVMLKSPLAISGPPYAWIDLYFQIDSRGESSSPQIRGHSALQPFENPREYDHVEARALPTWEWLRKSFTDIDLYTKAAAVCTNPNEPYSVAEGSPSAAGQHPEDRHDAGSDNPAERLKSLRDSQQRYLPPWSCLPKEATQQNIHMAVIAGSLGIEDSLDKTGNEVTVAVDTLVPFWLNRDGDGPRKLAFIRVAHVGDEVFYQGFIGDWDRLRPELLSRIRGAFPNPKLAPVLENEPLTNAHMINLPVRLVVPDAGEEARAMAWREIRGTVIATWLAAVGVLIVAGVGLRNLVALMERRMQFAYAVTHELRTPLTTFRLYSDMLSAGLVPNDAKQEYVDTLNRESQRLTTLVEDVLEYARLESRKVRLNTTETDGDTLLKVIEETLTKRCNENDIQACTENAMANGRRMKTDIDLVNRITTVLVDNAVRHVRGREKALVFVRLADGADRVYVDVIDSGPGIERGDSHNIFKPFRRGRSADVAAHGGIGLGLAIARSWASLLGGRLDLVARHHAQYGGAHFRLTMPSRSH